jgi:Flp pilus assembly pilin Flp
VLPSSRFPGVLPKASTGSLFAKDTKMKNWIMNFIADERGAESIEFSVASIVAAGGAIFGLVQIRNSTQSKQSILVIELVQADVD